ncbi:MAG TPA: hypothetical protein H9827_00105 [Candidatus Luteimonas excrementigallinarum]|nr:hypothetical protein [Candidatus Luteimonas excrementigallinarum]
MSVARPDAGDTRYETYTCTSRGNPLQLRLPAEAGEYKVRYIQAQKHTALVRKTIAVTGD